RAAMTMWNVPWLELAIVVPLLGAACLSRIGEPIRVFWTGLAFSGASLACAVSAWLGYALGRAAPDDLWSAQPYLFGRPLFVLDELSSALVPLVSLVHFLTVLATGRTKMRRFSLAWSLAYEAARLAMFGCQIPWVLVGLLVLGTVPGYVELANRSQPTRVYVLHMALFVCLLVAGWTLVSWEEGYGLAPAWATVPLLAAVLIRCGTAPVHCWLTDWFEHASFGIALVFVAPLTGVYLAVRLVLPIAP